MDNLSFSGEWSLDAARFGLADTIGEAVQDYYDLLFDNVHEFIVMNRDELRGCEAEDAQLREKLEDRSIDGAERKALEESREKNREEADRLREFLSGNRVIETGIRFSVEMEDDNEPELTDRFNAAPVAEKYACLVKHYMEEYRKNLAARGERSREDFTTHSDRADALRRDGPSAWETLTSFGAAGKRWAERLDNLERLAAGNKRELQSLQEYAENGLLVTVDAFRFGTEEAWKFFPDVADKYAEQKQEEYREFLESDPVRLHGDLMTKYSTECVAEAGQRFFELRYDRDHRQLQLREHEAAKPGLLKNLATFGNAGKTWRDRRTALTREMAEFEGKITEQKKIFGEGEFSENVRQRAKNSILSAHPEVVKACERHMARHWERKNEERLEKQEERRAGRDGDAGKSCPGSLSSARLGTFGRSYLGADRFASRRGGGFAVSGSRSVAARKKKRQSAG